AMGLVTAASFSQRTRNGIIILVWAAAIPAMIAPYWLGHFHGVYLIVCLAAALPLHALWLRRFLRRASKPEYSLVSLLIKCEMSAGLIALALDMLLTK
ncbi:MAG: hypothetical protein PHC61_15440, partial [Chitinivibrionales bacterium]|nr:hypothetical protein [Chitinivibrionales bacterium]